MFFQMNPTGLDLNVTGVWAMGITGRGVTSCLIDDGIEWRNPDILPNFSWAGSYDLDSRDRDPAPSPLNSFNYHGTRCAGEIAGVANNKVCGVGVAFRSRVAGIRILDGRITDHMEAFALRYKSDANDIYSCR